MFSLRTPKLSLPAQAPFPSEVTFCVSAVSFCSQGFGLLRFLPLVATQHIMHPNSLAPSAGGKPTEELPMLPPRAVLGWTPWTKAWPPGTHYCALAPCLAPGEVLVDPCPYKGNSRSSYTSWGDIGLLFVWSLP